MDAIKIESYAEELFNAERTRAAVPPITAREPLFNVDDAYAVQMINIKRASAMGCKLSGKKIGLTSPGIQRQLGVSEPDYGRLFSEMDCIGGRVDTAQLIQPKIEAELAFILKKGLRGGRVTASDVVNATDYVVAAFEIVDSRVADWKIRLPDTVADNASSGRYILSENKVLINGIDLTSIEMKLYKSAADPKTGGDKNIADWEPAGEGMGSAVLGDPCLSVAWLANKLWEYGVSLDAGEIVLSGAFSAAPAARRGDEFRADFTVFGSVWAKFV